MLVFIGTQTAEDAQGIWAAHLDETDGRLTDRGIAASVERPTCVLADPGRPVLYAVSEVGNAGDRPAEVLSFSVAGSDGALRPISRAPSGGGGATHLALDPAGRHLLVANFGGGQAATIPISPEGGLGPPLSVQTGYGSGPHRRQSGPHAHGVTIDPSGRFLLVPDMGADRIFVYRYDAETGVLQPGDPAYAQLPAGSGPRLLLFGRDGRFAYMLSELSAGIFVFRWIEQDGRLEPFGSVSLDGDERPDNASAAAFARSEDGRFLYASNRRTAMLHAYAIDAADGLLSEVQQIAAGGDRPWAAELSPGGRWMVVANQASNEVRVFAVDPVSGHLSATPAQISVPTPTGIAFIP